MKKISTSIFTLCVLIFLSSCGNSGKEASEEEKEVTPKLINYDDKQDDATENSSMTEINWLTWAEAVEKSKTDKKKVFVDMYTSWCGWCKKMDASTFKAPEVVEYMNKNFHAVKFNAERKDPITFRGQTFEFTKAGRRGAHGLAVALLDGRLGYPSFVYLDENLDRISISPGYKKADGMMNELTWVADNVYKTQTLKEFSAGE